MLSFPVLALPALLAVGAAGFHGHPADPRLAQRDAEALELCLPDAEEAEEPDCLHCSREPTSDMPFPRPAKPAACSPTDWQHLKRTTVTFDISGGGDGTCPDQETCTYSDCRWRVSIRIKNGANPGTPPLNVAVSWGGVPVGTGFPLKGGDPEKVIALTSDAKQLKLKCGTTASSKELSVSLTPTNSPGCTETRTITLTCNACEDGKAVVPVGEV
ncbi:MAG: hypothetical protein AAF628_17610 [Planctomycetota bacterium]